MIKQHQAIWDSVASENDLFFLKTTGPRETVKHITIEGQPLINFGSCSYFGLELDQRLKDAAIKAIQDYGVQYSSSVACVSLDLYTELEKTYSDIFGYPTLATPSTTLGHLSCLPILIGKNDLVIYDQQVHKSVQMAIKTTQVAAANCHQIPHNNLFQLERKLTQVSNPTQKVWYLCDGVYSMYGDFAPLNALEQLQQKYPQLHLYIDDAHGMSWKGKNGSGYALSELTQLDRTIIATSTSKCFGCAGGALIIPNPEHYETIKHFGPTRIFSGPMQPPLLGANLASAKLHLTPELYHYQTRLEQKIQLRNDSFKQQNLPTKLTSQSPISFIHIGDQQKTASICQQLKTHGFYVNPALYPVVGINRSGLRITVTCAHLDEEIEALAMVISKLIH